MRLLSWIDFCKNQHDIVCNQKYDRTLPYSYHLQLVYQNARKFIQLWENTKSYDAEQIYMACWGHDLIEDARLSYNDISFFAGPEVAEIIFLCTEMRGRSREERKNAQFYQDLATNELAVFVKLCDIMANSLYSTMTGSSMLKKQKAEWIGDSDGSSLNVELCVLGIKDKLNEHKKKFKPMFDYLDKIYAL